MAAVHSGALATEVQYKEEEAQTLTTLNLSHIASIVRATAMLLGVVVYLRHSAQSVRMSMVIIYLYNKMRVQSCSTW